MKLIGCGLLTVAAVTSALLLLAVAFITIRSYGRLETLIVKFEQHTHSLESLHCKFYYMLFFGREIAPFEFDTICDWHTEKVKDSSLLSERREPFIELFTVRPKRLLGLTWGPGDPSKKIDDVAQLVYIVFVPVWLVLVILSILPGVWLWRFRRWSREQRKAARRSLLLACSLLVGIPVVLLLLAAINTHFLGPREKPLYGRTSHPVVWPISDSNGIILKVMTYNIRFGCAYKGAGLFVKPERVAEHVRRIGQFIKEQKPDLVFLQEVAMESGPGSVNQILLLAETTGMHDWAYGEDVNQGLPFYRFISGNAILSKWPLDVLANQPMAVSRTFFQVGMWTQRTLWCKTHIGEQEVLLASIHLIGSKGGAEERSMQMRQILDFAGGRPAILAGDFNAGPDSEVIRIAVESGKFSVKLDGPPTTKSYRPTWTIDYILAPMEWKLIEHKVIQTDLSDHLPVLSTYRILLVANQDLAGRDR